jgi:Flp pilus assembly protein TadG
MLFTTKYRERRRAATLVETAFVLIPLMMLFLGIFQYGLILMDWNLLINAASQGCRFALANNTDPTISTDVQNIVINNMAGRNTGFTNFTVTVSGTHQGVNYTGNNVSALAAGDPITVTVTGNYRFLNLIPMVSTPGSLPMSTSATMICEGGP